MDFCLDCAHLKNEKGLHQYVCRHQKGERFNQPFPHKPGKMESTKKACRHYKAKAGLYVDLDGMRDLKFIERQGRPFDGTDAWVIGGGPNQDYYPDDYFDDKHHITLNWSCCAWPNSEYYVADPASIPDIVAEMGQNRMSKFVVTISRKTTRTMPAWWRIYGTEPIYMKYQPDRDQFSHTKEDFEMMAEQLFTGQPCEFIVGVTQACVGTQVAAALGAKRIILVGCWMAMGDAQKRGLSEHYRNIREGYSEEYQIGQHPHQVRGRESIARFAETFKRYGVEVIRHRFNLEKGDYEFVEVKSETGDLWNTSWGHRSQFDGTD